MRSISTDSIDFYPSLIRDYIHNQLIEKDWVDFTYDKNEILKRAATRAFNYREPLTHALRRQYEEIKITPAIEARIKLLEDPKTMTVCTGHQLSLFGGPAFFFSKIIECIQLSRELSRLDPEHLYLPIFWMASEDHDFDEIAEFQLFNHKLKWQIESKGPVGRLSVKSLEELVNQCCEIIGNSEKADPIKTAIRKAYDPSFNLAQATRILVNELLGDEGLLIIDGDDPALKSLFAPIAERELKNQIVEKSLTARIDAFENANYKAQAKPRAINLFYLEDHYRARIIATQDGFATADEKHSWTERELISIVHDSPTSISPTVFLRPVYQEIILPNVAYVGGAGEIAYWLELPPLFAALEVPFPIPIVRNSFIYWDEKSDEKLQKLGIELAELFEDLPLLEGKFVEQNAKNEISLSDYSSRITSIFSEIEELGVVIDPNLSKSVAGELKKTLSSIENLEKRFKNGEKRNFETQLQQLSSLKSKLFPNGAFQERAVSFFEFHLKSDENLFEKVATHCTPMDNSIKLLL